MTAWVRVYAAAGLSLSFVFGAVQLIRADPWAAAALAAAPALLVTAYFVQRRQTRR